MSAGTAAAESLAAELARIVGDSRVTSEPRKCQKYEVDGRNPRWVVYPSSAEQVAAVLKYTAERDLAVIPCRNLTKIATGNPPRRYDVALSLKDMNQVWYYEPADLVVSVEPGMKFSDLQHFLARHQLWLPLDPAGGARGSLGGILATNASGPLRQLYGGPRDMVLGMRIATADGKVIRTGGRVVKNVAGYDLAKLLIGSLGTLGVIVEATFKLYPLPVERATFVFVTGTLDKARELRRALQTSPLQPMRMVLLDPNALLYLRDSAGLAQCDGGWQLWLEAAGSERVLGRYLRELERIAQQASVAVMLRAKSDAANEAVWSLATSLHGTAIDTGAILLKASLPLAATEAFLNRVYEKAGATSSIRTVAQPGVGVIMMSLGPQPGAEEIRDAGSSRDRAGPQPPQVAGEDHENPSNTWSERAIELVTQLRALAIEMGGALVAEVLPKELKGRIDVWGPPGDDFEIMRKIKQAWDPKGILSPGRFVGGI